MARDADEAAKSLGRIRQLLADWLESSEKARGPVVEMLRLLEPIDALVHGGQQGEAPSEAGGPKYSIEMRKMEQVLVEHRKSGSTPYRCPRQVFEATVQVLADAADHLPFEKIVKGVEKKLSDAPEWQVRVVLRFFLSQGPPIWRARNKYRPYKQAKFEADAKAAWAALAKASK